MELGSITLTVPPISAETQTSLSSGVNIATLGLASTKTFSTISKVSALIKWAMLVVSEVLTKIFPLFVSPIPSGSTPTGISSIIILSFMSTTVTIASSSLAM